MKTKPKPQLDPTKCSEIIHHYDGGWYRGQHQCARKWSVKAKDGKVYCKQHYPDAVKKREALSKVKRDYDTAERAMGWFGCALYDALSGLVEAGDESAVKAAKRALKSVRSYRNTLTKGEPR